MLQREHQAEGPWASRTEKPPVEGSFLSLPSHADDDCAWPWPSSEFVVRGSAWWHHLYNERMIEVPCQVSHIRCAHLYWMSTSLLIIMLNQRKRKLSFPVWIFSSSNRIKILFFIHIVHPVSTCCLSLLQWMKGKKKHIYMTSFIVHKIDKLWGLCHHYFLNLHPQFMCSNSSGN